MRHNSLQQQFMSGNQFFKLTSIKNIVIESLPFLVTKTNKIVCGFKNLTMDKKLENKEPEILSFKTPNAFEKWLLKHHNKVNGILLRFYKKESGKKSITYKEAVDEALCYGWIDGRANKLDDESWIQKFTPRGARSIWSKKNSGNVERLTSLGKMKSPGLEEVEKAKADGRWAKAYDSPKDMQLPDDF